MSSIKDTVVHKLIESLGTGLYDSLVGAGFQLVELNLKGAFQSPYYAVRKKGVKSWADAFGQLDAFDQTVNPWVQTMFGMKSFTVGSTSSDVLFTNEGHMGVPHTSRTSVNNSNVQFSTSILDWDPTALVGSLSTRKNLGNKSVFAEEMTVYYGDLSRDPALDAFASSVTDFLGYKRATGVMSPYHFSDDNDDRNKIFKKVDWWSLAFTDKWFTEKTSDSTALAYMKRGLLPCLGSGLRGIKMIPVQIAMPNAGTDDDFTSYYMTIGIPVIDDGAASMTGLIIVGNDVRTRAYHDLRHSTDNTLVYGQTLKDYATTFMGTSLYGLSKAKMALLPPRNWSFDSVYDGDYLLPILCPPLDSVYGIVKKTTESKVEYDDGGVHVVELELEQFCTRITKEWYEKYYTTGFGLWQPRASNIQKNMLDKWNKMEFTHLNFALVSTPRNFTVSGLIHSLPLYKDYSRAKEKACQTNDFMSQLYSSNQSWGAVASKIERQPTRNYFISASHIVGFDAGIDLNVAPLAAVTWTSKSTGAKDVYDYPIYSWTRASADGVDEFTESTEVLDRIIDEVSQGAKCSIAVDILAVKAGYDYSAGADLAGSIKTVADNQNVKRSASSLAYSTGGEYTVADEYLANSGYPVVDNMQSPHREMMVIRCYAELDLVGASLLKLINSFTSEVILKRLFK